MLSQTSLRRVHFAGTAWFMLCIGYILVLALRQAGFKWWVIFSLSGNSVLIILMLVSLYLFAIFRGIDRSQKIEIEHPLTSSAYYTMFYNLTPLLGSFAGSLAMIGVHGISEILSGITMGTLATTFMVWIVSDPLMASMEKLLPASRAHRRDRLLQAKIMRQQKQQEREDLINRVIAQEEKEKRRWGQILQPYSGVLAELLSTKNMDSEQAEKEAVDMGVTAWKTGGLHCMKQLYTMTLERYKKDYPNSNRIEHLLSNWWDGIGTWRSPLLG
jgi:hypothetical protein